MPPTVIVYSISSWSSELAPNACAPTVAKVVPLPVILPSTISALFVTAIPNFPSVTVPVVYSYELPLTRTSIVVPEPDIALL